MKKLVIITLILMFASNLYSQSVKQDFLTFGFGAGIHGLSYNLNGYGDKKSNMGYKFQIWYKHLFTQKIGIATGLEFVNYNSSATTNFVQPIERAVDEDNKNYTHRTYFNDLEENQKINQLAIPIEMVYVIDLVSKLSLQIDAGFYVGIPVGNNFKTASGNLETRRFYYEQNLEIYGDYSQHHLYTKSDFKGEYDFKPTFGGLLGTQFLYSVDERLKLCAGFYGSLSFSSLVNGTDALLYNPDCMARDAYSDTKYNGVFNSNLTKKVNPFAVGFYIGLCYRINMP